MVEHKHFENDAIKMTASTGDKAFSDKVKEDEDKGIKIFTDFGEFTFFPSRVMIDPVGEPILYVKFNHKENLVLYHHTRHPGSRKAVIDLELSIKVANTLSGRNYVVRDIMDYIEEIERTIKKLDKGEIKLEDGICPGMEEAMNNMEK